MRHLAFSPYSQAHVDIVNLSLAIRLPDREQGLVIAACRISRLRLSSGIFQKSLCRHKGRIPHRVKSVSPTNDDLEALIVLAIDATLYCSLDFSQIYGMQVIQLTISIL